MGREAACTAHFGGKSSAGRALLETDHVLFRGGFRVKIPFAGLKKVDASNGVLTLESAQGVAAFDLGTDAAKWAEKIRNPPTLLSKLGVKPGLRVAVQGLEDAVFVEELRAASVEFAKQDLDILFLGARSHSDLAELSPAKLKPAGAIWVVYAKGRKEFGEAHVLAAGKSAGLVDTKVAAFSPTHTAVKFVIPVAQRKR